MARIVFEEKYQIHWLPACASIAAPTQAEITAGTEITSFVPKDGVNIGTSNNRVSTADISTKFDSEIMGSYGNSLSLKCFKDDATDTAWDLLLKDAVGFLVIAPYGSTAATEVGYVFPVQCGQPELPTSAANERQTFTSPMAVTSTPDMRAVFAA